MAMTISDAVRFLTREDRAAAARIVNSTNADLDDWVQKWVDSSETDAASSWSHLITAIGHAEARLGVPLVGPMANPALVGLTRSRAQAQAFETKIRQEVFDQLRAENERLQTENRDLRMETIRTAEKAQKSADDGRAANTALASARRAFDIALGALSSVTDRRMSEWLYDIQEIMKGRPGDSA